MVAYFLSVDSLSRLYLLTSRAWRAFSLSFEFHLRLGSGTNTVRHHEGKFQLIPDDFLRVFCHFFLIFLAFLFDIGYVGCKGDIYWRITMILILLFGSKRIKLRCFCGHVPKKEPSLRRKGWISRK